MVIDVTQEDIDKGWSGISFACPVARAVKRVTGYGWRAVSVGIRGNISVGGGHFNIPEVERFVTIFDEGFHRPRPFSFVLPV